MAAPLTAEQRRELSLQAYRMMLKRVTYTEIAERLGVHRNTVPGLVKEEQKRRLKERGKTEDELLKFERERAVATNDEVIRAAWQSFHDPNLAAGSLNRSGYLT